MTEQQPEDTDFPFDWPESAFPSTFKSIGPEPQHIHRWGMSLRDYFAAKALQGFIQYSATKGIYTPPDDQLAKAAYDLADAMLKAREEK